MEKLKEINNFLKSQNYNLAERLVVYSGAVVGALTPIAITYPIVRAFVKPESLLGETFSLLASAVINIVPLPSLRGMWFPISGYTSLGGGVFGAVCANYLRDQRFEKQGKESFALERELCQWPPF